MKYNIFILLFTLLAATSCDDYLTREPMDKVTDIPEFWNSEDNINSVALGLYDVYFPGYRTGWSRADMFAETNVADWTDNNTQTAATFFTKVAPATDANHWYFKYVRRINILIDRVGESALPEEARNHWLGVGRFMRAMEYAKLVSKFGDVPYYDQALENTDVEQLYRARDSREFVMDKVKEDLDFAVQYVRENDRVDGLFINKSVVLAFASRLMLFEGTWQKYNDKNNEKAVLYLKAAKDYASTLMEEGKYSLADSWKSLTTSLDLGNNPEIIIYRSYVEGVVMHSLMSFQNTEIQNDSPSKSLLDAYLTTNGLPIRQANNPLFSETKDQWFFDMIADRDPRLLETIDPSGLRLPGVNAIWASSGVAAHRYYNPDIAELPAGTSATNTTDAPVMKYNEVLMNYIEAAVELADLGAYSLTQADFDKSFNVIRARKSTNMPAVTLSGSDLMVNNVKIEDPERDADVSSIIWEVRRERRVEMAYDGTRFNDIRRWGKLEYADQKLNEDLNKGVWLDKARYITWYNETMNPTNPLTMENLSKINLDRAGDKGYIVPIADPTKLREMGEKDYLYPIPVDQITLYEAQGKKLNQNPGW